MRQAEHVLTPSGDHANGADYVLDKTAVEERLRPVESLAMVLGYVCADAPANSDTLTAINTLVEYLTQEVESLRKVLQLG